MPITNNFDNELLKLIFHAVPLPGIADNALENALDNLYVSLHTENPVSMQTDFEVSYAGYARASVERNENGWIVSGINVNPVDDIHFPTMTGGLGGLVTHFGIGELPSGGGRLFFRGLLTSPINVVEGMSPEIENTPGVPTMAPGWARTF